MSTLLCHTIWMQEYRGPEDEIFAGGFDYAQEHGFGHELFNFLPANGSCYGFVQVKTGTVNISRLGADNEDTFIDDVTVIWTAPRKEGGRFIVGWYKGARVHRNFQQGMIRGRVVEGRRVGYMIEALASDCTLVPEDDRDFEVPYQGKQLPGTASVFYVDESDRMADWLDEALAYIEAWDGACVADEASLADRRGGWPRNHDPAHKALVEDAAIQETKRYLGKETADRQKHNCGWDLEFDRAEKRLCVEVKGLSGDQLAVELTPNEYAAMKRAAAGNFSEGQYRLAVVTRALGDDRRFHLFAHKKGGTWRCERTGREITVEERTGARLG